ncbi:HBS1-like protein [Caerostris extrusa]|uniref:HBS1-like protein n=1 Tax=Caerostris extrusa TaxID=172846 RepID=A0AAV4TGJ8_CAEEX|nr:HBS1-like protein [Caerostris extrusa]
MARHRNVRALDVDEEYDDFHSCYGHSVEDDFCISPRTEAQFLYNRNSRTQMNAYFETPESVPEEETSGEESLNTSVNSISTSELSSLDRAKLQSCVIALQDVVGDTIPEEKLQKAALDHGFNLEEALDAILQDKAPKPQRVKTTVPLITPAFVDSKNKSEIRLESVSDVANNVGKLDSEQTKQVQKEVIGASASPANKKIYEKNDSIKVNETYKEKDQIVSLSTYENLSANEKNEELKSSTVKSTRNEKSGKNYTVLKEQMKNPLLILL